MCAGRKTYFAPDPVAKADVIECHYVDCAHGEGLAGNGQCANYGDWSSPHCPYFTSEADYERNGFLERIQDRLDKTTKSTKKLSTDSPYLRSILSDVGDELIVIQRDVKELKDIVRG